MQNFKTLNTKTKLNCCQNKKESLLFFCCHVSAQYIKLHMSFVIELLILLISNNADLFLTFVTGTISRTDEGQPRPKYIFNKCGTSTFLLLQRFGPSPSPN